MVVLSLVDADRNLCLIARLRMHILHSNAIKYILCTRIILQHKGKIYKASIISHKYTVISMYILNLLYVYLKYSLLMRRYNIQHCILKMTCVYGVHNMYMYVHTLYIHTYIHYYHY